MASMIPSAYAIKGLSLSEADNASPCYVDIDPPGIGHVAIIVSQYIIEIAQKRTFWIPARSLIYERYPIGVKSDAFDATTPLVVSEFWHSGERKGECLVDRPQNRPYTSVQGFNIENTGVRVKVNGKRKKSTQQISIGYLTMSESQLGYSFL